MRPVNYEHKLRKQYIVQVPLKRPKENVHKDAKGRTWARPNTNDYSGWEHAENTWYCWFKRDTVPEEGEVVFDNFRISNVYRYRSLLRAVIELSHI